MKKKCFWIGFRLLDDQWTVHRTNIRTLGRATLNGAGIANVQYKLLVAN